MAQLSLLLVAGILAIAAAGCPDGKFAKWEKKYNKCLAKGFNSTLGCSADLNGKSLNEKKTATCEKLEKKLVKKCDYTCVEPTAAPTKAPTAAPTVAATLPASERAVCSDEFCYNAVGSGSVYLALGEQIWASDGSSYLEMQTDGNLVLRCANLDVIWSSGTYGNEVPKGMVFQSDGNLVLYNSERESLYSSGTHGEGGIVLVLQTDNNLVIYTADREAIWDSGTSGDC